jgi:hypothetical protein
MSVVFVAPMMDATIWVDYDNDGTPDDSFDVDYIPKGDYG